MFDHTRGLKKNPKSKTTSSQIKRCRGAKFVSSEIWVVQWNFPQNFTCNEAPGLLTTVDILLTIPAIQNSHRHHVKTKAGPKHFTVRFILQLSLAKIREDPFCLNNFFTSFYCGDHFGEPAHSWKTIII